MVSNDVIHRFIFDDCDVRGNIATLTKSYQDVLKNNTHAPAIRELLGEFLAAVSLLTSTLKFEGKIILQARGDGPISTIMAECSHDHTMRGIVRLNEGAEMSDALAQEGTFKQLVGNGVLVISIEAKAPENFTGKLERYQGIVPMDSDSLAVCLERYFEQSEQLATRIWLTANDSTATGFLLQALPQQINTDPEVNRDKWETLVALSDTISSEELLTLEHEQILHRLFHEQELRLFEPAPLAFSCSCSKARCASAIISLGKEDIEQLLIERSQIDVDCQFCNQHYHFSPEEVRKLIGGDTLH